MVLVIEFLRHGLAIVALPFLLYALIQSDIAKVSRVDLTIWIAHTLMVFFALSLSIPLPDGISLQYSGAAYLALTIGFYRALLSTSLLLLIVRPVSEWGISLWVDALLPVWLATCMLQTSRRYLPANPFVFLLGCGFLGLFLVYGVQVIAGTMLRSALLKPLDLIAALSTVFSDQVVWGLMLAAGEATLEGMIITLLVAYYPGAVAGFDDRFYLSRPM